MLSEMQLKVNQPGFQDFETVKKPEANEDNRANVLACLFVSIASQA